VAQVRWAYYNEWDKPTAAWLRELIKRGLIADGEVDDRSIAEVQPDDVRGFKQAHFFAGIGGWSYALRLAGWPDDRPVWTGSCPCQFRSSAARGRNSAPDLWPSFFLLIAAIRPRVVFGEQVASAIDWLDCVRDDMASIDYETAASIIPAISVGKDHIRNRIYFACHTDGHGESGLPVDAKASGLPWHRDEPIEEPRAYGLPAGVVYRGAGNAIVPQVAAQVIAAYMDCRG
jgi:DNA (cytosine-5)-methyltransferase 1